MTLSAETLGVSVDTRDVETIARDAIGLLSVRLPEWVPRNASPEVALLEAVAQAASEVADSANGLVGAVVEAILAGLHGVPRLPGSVAEGVVRVTFSTSQVITVPVGTQFLLPDFGIYLQVSDETSVNPGLTIDLPVATSGATSAGNGLGAGVAVDIVDLVPGAVSAAITTDLAGGADPEDDAAYLARAVNRLARTTSSLVVADHFAAYVLEDGRAVSARAFGAWDGVAVGTVGADAGHVTVCCYGRGAQLSAEARGDLEDEMQAMTAAGIGVHVNAAALGTVNVAATVHALPTYDHGELDAACAEVLGVYLAPETWTWGAPVYTSSLIAKLALVEGVDFVESVTITIPGGSVAILSSGNAILPANALAAAGTVAVTVAA